MLTADQYERAAQTKTTTTTSTSGTTTTANPYQGANITGTSLYPYSASSPTVAASDATYNAIYSAGTSTTYPYTPGYRPVFQNGTWVQSKDPGYVVLKDGTRKLSYLVNSTGGFSLPQSGEQFYNLDADPRMLYGSSSPAGRNLLIKQMVSSGFLDPNYVGDYASEIRALTEAMDFANAIGLEVGNAMSQRAAAGGGRRGGGGGGQVRTYRLSAPQDLTRYVKSVAQDTIGRELTDAEAAGFIQQYQQQELAYQKAAYAGGSAVEPPAAETAAINYVRSVVPKEESAYQYLGYMNMLFDSVGSV